MFASAQFLHSLPQVPGVYLMKDAWGNIIYIGKAKDLKNRVSHYFQSSKRKDPKTIELVKHICSLEYIVLDTELDALLTECRLIKEHKPLYNRQLKSDSKHVYLKLPAETFPRFSIANGSETDNAMYLGPFPSRSKVEWVIKFIEEFFPIRKCPTPRLTQNPNGCLFLQMNTCCGACTGNVTPQTYNDVLQNILLVLHGKDSTPHLALQEKMLAASEELQFELAAKYRAYELGLKHVIGKLSLSHAVQQMRNMVVIERINEQFSKAFYIRGNKLLASELYENEQLLNASSITVLQEGVKKSFGSLVNAKQPLTQQDFDEAQIIYSYLKKHANHLKSTWIPTSWHKDERKLHAALGKLLAGINSDSKRNSNKLGGL